MGLRTGQPRGEAWWPAPTPPVLRPGGSPETHVQSLPHSREFPRAPHTPQVSVSGALIRAPPPPAPPLPHGPRTPRAGGTRLCWGAALGANGTVHLGPRQEAGHARAREPGRPHTQDLRSLVCRLLRLLVTAWPGAGASFTPAEMDCSLCFHDGHPSLWPVHLTRRFHSQHTDRAAGLFAMSVLALIRSKTASLQALVQPVVLCLP